MIITPNTSSSEEQVFIATLEKCLQNDNEKRTAAEAIYQNIPDEKKAILLMSTLCNIALSGQIRSFAAVMLRRLFRRQFGNFWPKYSPDQQMTLKRQLLDRIIQIDDDEVVRKNVCFIAAELARNSIGIKKITKQFDLFIEFLFLIKDENNQLQWPEIIEFLVQSANSSLNKLKESALIIFEVFPEIFSNQAEQLTQIIHQIFFNCLNDQDTKVRYTAATSFAAYLKHNCENTQLLNIYRDCLPCLISTITQSLTDSNDDTVLKALINIAENTAKYLRPAIDNIFKLCLETIKKKGEFEESRRHLALEVLITLSETASGMVRKVKKQYLDELVSQLLDMMVDLNDDLKWSIKDTIEDEEDNRNAFIGERSLDRLACALGGKTIFNYILKTVRTMLQNPDWRYRYAGLMAISTISEGFHKEISVLLDNLVDGHPRVRYAACNVLGQMSTDFQGKFQEKFHSKIIPSLLSILDDYENPRTQAHGGAALVNFAEGCPSHLLVEHLPQIIEKLEQVLNRKYEELVQHNRKLVLEQMVTTLAAIADTVAQDFSPYYDRFMPQLKYLFENVITPDYRILRGKTIECISLIGLAVGKEKCINDCNEIMQEFVKTQVDFENLGYNDPQISYFIGAWTRICQILGKDFEQYLPIVMGPVLKVATFQPELTVLADNDTDVEEDDNWEELNVDDQTTGLEEKASACSMLVCCAKELKEGFVNYVEETTKLMIPLLRFNFHKGIRTVAAESLPYLLDCVKLRDNDYACQLWQYMNKELFKAIEIESDHEVLGELFLSLSKCIEILGVLSLTGNELKELTIILDNHLKKHFERSNERAEKRHDEDYDEETEEEMVEEDACDAYILTRLSNIIHSLLITYKDSYLVYFDTLVPHFNALIQPTRSISDRQCALCIFDDVIQFTGAYSHRYSQFFLARMAESLADSSPEIRQAAAYGFGVMGRNGGPVYAHACAEALPLLFTLISVSDSRSTENNTATENAISAVTKIFKYNNSYVDNLDKLHQVWFSWLPIHEDTEEIPYVYDYLCDLIESNNPIIIGQNNSNICNVINLFTDAFAKSSIEVNSVIGQRMMLILQQIQTANINLPLTSTSLLQNIFSTHIVPPRLAPTVDQVYRNNDLINQSLQLVPYILLSERSLQILKKCDKANDTKNDIIQHIIERMQVIEITVDEKRLKYCSIDGISYKSSDDTYILQINKELFEDCINAFNQPMVLNKAKLRLVISICHEFIHHKIHKYLLNDKWSKAKNEKTPPELVESGFYWEKHVIGGRVVKINKTIYSFITNNGEKIDLEDDLCAFLLDKVNYDDENSNAYSRKEKQQLQSGVSIKRSRKKIERLYLDLNGTQKSKKTRSEPYQTYRLTPIHPIFAEITLENDTNDDIIYPDLPQNCGALRAYLYKYLEDDGEMFSVDLPINDYDWTCSGLRERCRATPYLLPDYVIIKPNESKTFTIKLMEITTDNEEENMKITGHYYLEIEIGYNTNDADDLYVGERTIEFNIEYDNGMNNDENIDAEQQEMPVLKQ
ncbi:unnamed protein product [Rotaria sp. Silwood1]|nr:unnamed protein product [Rotaria sp. Silwood1]